MRKKEELVRLFAQTDPSPKEFSIQHKEDSSLQDKISQYQRERLALEVQLDIRQLLEDLLSASK